MVPRKEEYVSKREMKMKYFALGIVKILKLPHENKLLFLRKHGHYDEV